MKEKGGRDVDVRDERCPGFGMQTKSHQDLVQVRSEARNRKYDGVEIVEITAVGIKVLDRSVLAGKGRRWRGGRNICIGTTDIVRELFL